MFHQYVIRVPDRAGVQARMRADGIGTGIHYPMPVHTQPAYHGRVALGPARCAGRRLSAPQVLSLPMYPELSDDDVGRVCDALRRL